MKRQMGLMIAMGLAAAWGVGAAFGADRADNWPTWRGPDASGAAAKGNPPVTWSETENVKWKVKLPGLGSSTPIIWEDKIFFQAAVAVDKSGKALTGQGSRDQEALHQFTVVCMDRGTGNVLWQKTARQEVPHEGHHGDHGFASHSPVTDGQRLWVNYGSRGVYCYDLNGKQIWGADLGTMRTRNGFGEGTSPAIAGNAVIVLMDGESGSRVVALDKNTGKEMWQKDRDEVTTWATPLAVEVNGKMQAITCATNRIRSYDAHTGAIVWECDGLTTNVIPSPVTGFGKAFCTSGFRGNSLKAIDLGHTGDLSGTDAIEWEVDTGTPYVPSPLLLGDKIYVLSGNKAIVSCYQAQSGKANFVKQRITGMRGVYASPVGVGDRAYFVGRDGKSVVIKRSETLEILATNALDDEIDASPAIVGDELFLKGKQYLYCLAQQ